MSDQEHVSYQKRYFETNHKKSMQPTSTPYIERQTERMIRSANLTVNDRIIDIGCGIGKYTLNLLQKGFQIEGLDIAQGLLDQAKKHNRTGKVLPLHCADISRPPENLFGQYDVAIGFFALHHIFDLKRAFEGMAKILKPNGKLHFLEPNPYNFLYYLQILLTPKMTWQGDKGILNMRKKILIPALEKGGFTDFSIDRFGFFPPFITNLKGAVFLERQLEKAPFWKPLLPFQMIQAKKRADAHSVNV